MKIAVFAFSKNGYKLNKKIETLWEEEDEYQVFVKTDALKEDDISEHHVTLLKKEQSMQDVVANEFLEDDALIFLSSTGIAVRMIAPYLAHKSKDPAVIVIDELGKHCISLLSGHLGGANELCEKIASYIQAEPVITTASDLNHKVAVDVFAKTNQLAIANFDQAKEITGELLQDEIIAVTYEDCLEQELGYSVARYENVKLPEGYVSYETSKSESRKNTAQAESPEKIEKTDKVTSLVYITQKVNSKMEENLQKDITKLQLIPQNILIGIGCKKNTPESQIEEAIFTSLSKHQIHEKAVKGLYSIDLKKDEPGILDFCRKYDLPFTTYSTEELSKVQGDFSSSDFVKEVTGIDNVCERSTVLGGGRLFVKKEVYSGVTIAMSIEV